MKGITKIQLIDAETNKVKQEIIEENVVTDNFNDILNAVAKRIHNLLIFYDYTTSQSQILLYKLVNNELKNIFGGILLLNETQALTNKLPIGNVIGIGGKSESIVNTVDVSRDGIFLPAESGDVTGGYKFVWQWGQTEGNGDVNSICLTPPSIHDKQAINFEDAYFSYLEILGNGKGFPYYNKAFYYDFDEDKMYYAKDNDVLYKLDIKNSIGINKKQSDNDYLGNGDILNDTDIPSSGIQPGSCIEKYNNEIIVGILTGSPGLKLMRFNKDTGAYLGDFCSEIPIVNGTSDGIFGINDSYIAVYTSYANKEIKIYNHSGVFQRTISLSTIALSATISASIRFIPNSNEFIFSAGNMSYNSKVGQSLVKIDASNGNVNLLESGITAVAGTNTIGYIASSLSYPIVVGSASYSYSGREYLLSLILPLVLLTINNLGSTITKTSADILKITYTLLEA